MDARKIEMLSPWRLNTPEENDIYRQITDESVRELAEDMARHGVITPITVNREGWIISGNRRVHAARLAGLDAVPCIVEDVPHGTPEFTRRLVSANAENRVKTLAEVAAEKAATIDPREAERWVQAKRIEERETHRRISDMALDIEDRKRRNRIVHKRELANAVLSVILGLNGRGIRPTLRQVHYMLLNNPPVKNSKTGERYRNDLSSYRSLSDVATRMRLAGELPLNALLDAGRSLTPKGWYFGNAEEYTKRQIEDFGKTYRRDCMASQDAFYCFFVEKQTQEAIFSDWLADTFPGMPLAVLRGYASTSAIDEIRQRWIESGKHSMVLVGMTDCDPCGEDIKESLGKTLREMGEDFFSIIPAGLTHEQAEAEGARQMFAKENARGGGRTKAAKFAARHGGKKTVYELESIAPERLLAIAEEAVKGVIDVKRFNAELDEERREMPRLMATAKALYASL